MTNSSQPHWGEAPWTIDYHPPAISLPGSMDFAVVGAGFTGLSAAAELRRLDPSMTVAVFEAESVGARSSGHTGGLVLAETAAGDMPGLGDVLAGYTDVLKNLEVDGDVALPGAWELDRTLRISGAIPGDCASPGRWLVAPQTPGKLSVDLLEQRNGTARSSSSTRASIGSISVNGLHCMSGACKFRPHVL